MNVPNSCAAVITAGKASYVELSTVLGVQDLYDILEIMIVEAENRRRALPKDNQ